MSTPESRTAPVPRRILGAALAALALVVAGCAAPEEEPLEEPTAVEETAAPEAAAPETAGQRFAAAFAGPIEETHGTEAWYGREAIAGDLSVEFGGNRVLDGHLVFTPQMAKARLELDAEGDGPDPAVVWDGDTAWVSPADAEFPRARFHVLTWPYFLAAPMKLRDPGTRLEDLGQREMQGQTYDVARLSFEGGVGDTPDDWYVLYRDPETSRLAAMAYIVTYGTPREAAEAEPHAITYENFTTVEGVTLPQTWQFWLWNEEEGIHGDPIGRVELSNLRFVSPEPGTFEVPEGAREEALPEPQPAPAG